MELAATRVAEIAFRLRSESAAPLAAMRHNWFYRCPGNQPLVYDPGDDLPVLVVPDQKGRFGRD